MKNILFRTIVALFFINGIIAAQVPVKTTEAEVRTVVADALRALSDNNVTKFGSFLTENCIHVNPWGEQINGREAIVRHFQSFHKSEVPKIEMLGSTISFPSMDSAVMVLLFKEGANTFREVVIVVREKGIWRIASFLGIEVKRSQGEVE